MSDGKRRTLDDCMGLGSTTGVQSKRTQYQKTLRNEYLKSALQKALKRHEDLLTLALPQEDVINMFCGWIDESAANWPGEMQDTDYPQGLLLNRTELPHAFEVAKTTIDS